MVRKKSEYYHKECKHLSKWIEKMWAFKTDAERDRVVDDKEITQWREILDQYEKSITQLKKPGTEDKIDIIKLKEQVDLLLKK